MNTQTLLKILGSILLYLFLQLFVMRTLVFFDVAFCFLYISVIIFMPHNVPTTALMILAFVMGLVVDMFYNTMGIHASACVLIAFARNYIIKILFPTRGIENEVVISLDGMGTERFIRYIVIMTLVHHSLLFMVEAGSFHFFLNTSLKIVASLMFSSTMIFLLHIYFKSLQNS